MCTLLAFVDDATSQLMQLRFVASESAFDYFRATRAYLETHGKPVAFYSDKHSIFRVNTKDAVGGEGITQFGRALTELNIDIICANSPQAKGRVERAFGTLQDRLVKELRLAGISTIAAANAWLPGFMADYNRRFGRPPTNAKDLHRKLTAVDNLDEMLAWRESRRLTEWCRPPGALPSRMRDRGGDIVPPDVRFAGKRPVVTRAPPWKTIEMRHGAQTRRRRR